VAEFLDNYLGMTRLIETRLGELGVASPTFEAPEVAPYCFIALPRQAILDMPTLEQFVDTVRFKLINRGVSPARRAEFLANLESGEITREEFLDEIAALEQELREIRIEWT
jgi:hypothetical protein